MDMRGQAERRFAVHLERERLFRFQSQASEDGRLHGRPFASDEPDPIGEASAPSTPSLLASALGHCLSAALIEVLRRAHLEVSDCETDVVAVVKPNDQGLPRIDHVEVVIRPLLVTTSPRTQRCEEIFENYCTVTSSVRRGIDVAVKVDWQATSRCVESSTNRTLVDSDDTEQARGA